MAAHKALADALEERNAAREELGLPPQELLDKWLANELHDMEMYADHCSKIYYWASDGRISKPNTLPGEVIRVAEDLETERTWEAVKEETASLRETIQSVEWVESDDAEYYCPRCSGWKPHGHAPDCAIAKALREGK